MPTAASAPVGRRPSPMTRLSAPSRRLAMAAACLASVAWLAGCAGAPKPPPPTLVLASLQASASVNPDIHKRPSPVVVRVYELKSAAAFEAADFVSLFEKDQATLAAELVGREEFVLRPGETRPWDKTVDAQTQFIGIMAAFRDLERARWKTVVPVTPNVRNVITVRADAITVSASVTTAAP